MSRSRGGKGPIAAPFASIGRRQDDDDEEKTPPPPPRNPSGHTLTRMLTGPYRSVGSLTDDDIRALFNPTLRRPSTARSVESSPVRASIEYVDTTATRKRKREQPVVIDLVSDDNEPPRSAQHYKKEDEAAHDQGRSKRHSREATTKGRHARSSLTQKSPVDKVVRDAMVEE